MQTINFGDNIQIPSGIDFLILDDEENVRDSILLELERLGFCGQIYQAATMKEAADVLNNSEIHFVLADWSLPDGNGQLLLEKFRKADRFKKVPFLMVTGNDDIEDMIRAADHGVSEYLVKPWTAEEFDSKISLAWEKENP
ncbi:MAG: response regulator [Halobacteriovoraceae bacterium]|jgi:two-component system, chemotaxis family, chemotaxis protein CheY|nr:response regulator [Halobacteriovoraceae bacterium]MBT5094636.1 response regulator [Halobacteriovoraceae bacterium]